MAAPMRRRPPSPAPTPIPASAPVLRPCEPGLGPIVGRIVVPSVAPACDGAEVTAVGPAVAVVGIAFVWV